MSLTRASELAPSAIYLPTRHGVYEGYASRVRQLARDYTPVAQVASIDEMFLDFSGCERLYHRAGDASADATIERVVRQLTDEIQALPPPTCWRSGSPNTVVMQATTCFCSPAVPAIPPLP